MELTGFLTASHWTCLLSVVRPEKHITEFLGYRSAAEIGSKKTALLPQDSKTRPVEKESKISGVELTLVIYSPDGEVTCGDETCCNL